MKKYFFLIITICLFFSSVVQAFEGPSTKTVLDNGLTVLVSEMPQSPVVSVYGLVKTGSATEGKYLGAGLSHFMEHMLFKGTNKRKVGEIAALIQSIGGEINASTGKNYTIFTITVPFKEFDTALDVLSDILMNSSFDPVEIERERKVIFGEMRLYNDNPDRHISDLVYQQTYFKHPYKHPTIGYPSVFAQLTRDDLLNYYHTNYLPNNIVVSVAGHVQSDDVLPKIKTAFAGFVRKPEIIRNTVIEPPQVTPRRYEENYPTNLTRLSLSFQGVSVLNEDMFAMDVLAKVLGQGESSYLFLNIYKKGLVYEISSYDSTPVDQGFFGINCVLEDAKLDAVLKAIWQQIELIKTNGVTEKDLLKAKNQVVSEYVFGHQESSAVADTQAIDEAYTGDYQFSKKYIDGVSSVTQADILRVARQYLDKNKSTLVVLHPEDKNKAPKQNQTEIKVSDIEKIKLDNGVTLLLREDHTNPLVVFRAIFQGGLRQETQVNNGISKMMALLWFKGTKLYSARELSEYIESLGMDAGSFSGKNSFGLNINTLSKDWNKGLDLMEELIKRPTFPEEELPQIKEDTQAVIRQREDNISSFTSHKVQADLFAGHPLSFEEEGTVESVNNISRNDIEQFYKSLATSSNMVISVFGDFNKEEMTKLLKAKFSTIPNKISSLKMYEIKAPAQIQEKTFRLNKEQAMVTFGFQGPSITSVDRNAVEVMTTVLGSSFSGRLFNHVREKLGQAYTLGGNFVPSIDTGFIYFYVLTTDDKVETVKALVQNELKVLQKDLVGQEELKDVKTYLKGSFENNLETNGSLSFTSSLDELYGLGFDHYKNYNQDIDKVDSELVRQMAIKYLDLNKAVVVMTRPAEKNLNKQ